MGIIDKVDPENKKEREVDIEPGSAIKKLKKRKDSGVGLKHIEWLLRTIGESERLRGTDLQVAIDTVRWLQEEYTRLQK